MRARWGVCRLTLVCLLVGAGSLRLDAHQDPRHRLHSCPSDRGSYICGDKERCEQCPDNQYCLAGKPRASAPQTSRPATPTPMQPQHATVTRVIDGDTLQLSTGEEVRLIGVDTPETKHPRKSVEPFGKEASAFTTRMVEGKPIWLEFDVQRQDKYKRLLAYVYVGDRMLNAELVRQGYAQVATFPPNVKHQELFLNLQRRAREARPVGAVSHGPRRRCRSLTTRRKRS